VASGGSASIHIGLVPDATIQDLDPVFVRSDLDLKLQILGPVRDPASGDLPRVVASFDPRGDLLSGSFPVTLPAAGSYLVSLTGVGDGDTPSRGYSSYGSLGEYRLTIEFPTPLTPGGGGSGAVGGGGGSGPVPVDGGEEDRLRVKVSVV